MYYSKLYAYRHSIHIQSHLELVGDMQKHPNRVERFKLDIPTIRPYKALYSIQ